MEPERFHINKSTGNTGKCTAKKKCPFGDMETEHYNSRREARTAYERKNGGSFGPALPANLLRDSYGNSSPLLLIRPLMDAWAQGNGYNFEDSRDYAYSFLSTPSGEIKCLVCGDAIAQDETPNWDHVNPVSRFGLKYTGNWVPEHAQCNQTEKSDRPMREVVEKRVEAGTHGMFETIKDYDKFILEFSAPYRERFPEIYKLNQEFNPAVDDRQQILKEYFGFDINLDFTAGRRRYDHKDLNKDVWDKIKADPGVHVGGRIDWSSENNRKDLNSALPRVQQYFREDYPNRKLKSLTAKEFKKFVDSSLAKELERTPGNSTGYQRVRNVLRGVSSAVNRSGFVHITDQIPSAAKFEPEELAGGAAEAKSLNSTEGTLPEGIRKQTEPAKGLPA